MEYVEGIDLRKLVKEQGPLPVAVACEYVRQAALGLQHAFEHGLVHRDVKPSNLLLQKTPPGQAGAGPVVKVLDLGLARLEPGGDGDSSSTLTESGAVMGTPDYLAPEQARRSHEVDVRADLYSLGCTLYFLLTGKVPFPGGTLAEKIAHHLMDEPEPVEQLRPEVPPGIAAVVRKLMAKKPDQRYRTPAEVAAVLAQGGEPVPAAPLGEAGTEDLSADWARAVDPDNTLAHSAASRQGAGKRRGRWWLPAGGAALLVLVGFLLRPLFGPQRATSRPDPHSPVVFRVAANQPWQDSGIDVVEGEVVTLVPEGIWRNGQAALSARGMEKAPRSRNVLPEAPFFCLLVRVGDEPAPTPVPGKQTIKPQRSGRLFLQVNDLDLEDNSGGLQVAIEGGLHTGERVPAPPGTPVQAADAALPKLAAEIEAGAQGLASWGTAQTEAERERLQRAVLDFVARYPTTPAAARATGLSLKLVVSNSIGLKLALIPAGDFVMGSPTSEEQRKEDEGPQHRVRISRRFYLGVCEVTQGQYEKVMEGNPSASKEGPDHPVDTVSWNDARDFCTKLSDLPEEKAAGRHYRLPTEAEWEYACRAGTTTEFYCGRSLSTKQANYCGVMPYGGGPKEPFLNHAARVGSYAPNALGLYDMAGNVWEWCSDWYADRYPSDPSGKDPQGPESGDCRLIRGGSWVNDAGSCRAAFRSRVAPDSRHHAVGFRVACSQD
jgi:formylglycine-generating enzyme required for sulfatase activity